MQIQMIKIKYYTLQNQGAIPDLNTQNVRIEVITDEEFATKSIF